jgi:type IV secretory pathway VirB6-like protein
MLKKALFILIAAVTLFVLWAINCVPVFGKMSDNFELYISEHSSNAGIVKVKRQEFPFVRNVTGESCKLKADNFSVIKFFEDFQAEIVFIEETEEGVSYYGYSPLIKYHKDLRGERINLHVFVGGEQVTVGTPIIYGSF